MRLGISTSLQHKDPADWAKQMKEMGCKSVVFPVDCNAPEELIQGYVKEAKANDLVIAEVGIWRNALARDDEERKQNLDYSIRQLALADRIGAKCCVNVAGSAGEIWDAGYRENFTAEMWNKTVSMIQTIIDEVKPVNTYFSLETMPWMYPTSPEEYKGLMEDVARDRFSAHMDIINMINCPERYFFQEEFLDRAFELLGKDIKSCHLKDVLLLPGYTFQLLECGCGKGAFHLEHYAELANSYNPDMPMIIEHLSSDQEYRDSMVYVQNRLKQFI